LGIRLQNLLLELCFFVLKRHSQVTVRAIVGISSNHSVSIESDKKPSTELGLILFETFLYLVFIVKVDTLSCILTKLDQPIFIWVCQADISVAKWVLELREIRFVLLNTVLSVWWQTITLKAVELVLRVLKKRNIWEQSNALVLI